MSRLLVLLALALHSTADAQPIPTDLQPSAEEVEAWRRAAERFTQRLTEVHADTVAYAAQRRTEAHRRVAQRYDGLIQDLVVLDRSHRDTAIEQLESFLGRNPTGELAFSARFRLAELRFEQAQERYLEASEAYYEAIDADDDASTDLVEPTIDFSPSIEQYRRIIEDNLALPPEQRWEHLDGVFVLLGNALYQETSAQRDEEEARRVLRQLIAEIPHSDLVDRAYLFLGGLEFAKGDYDAAIAEYEGVVAKGPEAAYYYEALYQLAWTRFKLSEYDRVLSLFAELLDHSEQLERATGKASPVAQDAKRFMAFSFADLALIQGRDAHEVAVDWFAGKHPRYEREVFVELADVLRRYGRGNERLAVLTYLQSGPVIDGQPAWTHRADNPAFQGEIVDMLSRDPIVMDLVRAGEERIELTERYGEQSAWWRANRNHPEALAVAREHIESGLLQVAEEYFVRAQEARDPTLYAKAAEKYVEYLDAFPIADDWYDQQWYLANAYKYAENWQAAADVFERLFRGRRYHPYGGAALYELMNARLIVTQQRTGPPDRGCEGCTTFSSGEWARTGSRAAPVLAVERTYPSAAPGPDGEAVHIPVYRVPADRLAFIEAVDVLLGWEWTEPDPRELPPNFPDYREAFEEQRTTFLYLTGQMLYHANRFDEARERLERVVQLDPRSIEAQYSAGLIVDSYLAEGDLQQVRNVTKRFSAMILGPSDTSSEVFASALEGSTFELANALAAEGQHAEAAEAFLSFMREFPESESLPAALNNAAFYMAEAGRIDRANELYEEFVERFPTHEWTPRHLFVIASNYEAVFELERAIDYFERLHQRFPDDPNAPDALWEAAFLAVGLGRHEQAARGFERYAERYPDRPDAEDTFWRAGEQWEKVSDRDALAFYARYRDRYGLTHPDHALQAEARIAAIHERRGETRSWERQLERIVTMYDRIRASGGALGADAIHSAAGAEFPTLLKAFETLTADRLSGDDARDAKLLQDIKPQQIKAFEDKVRGFVSKYPGAFEWNSGAFLLQAKAALYFADLGLGIQCPANYTEEQCWAFQDILEEQVFPEYYAVQDVGVQRLSELVDVALEQGRHSAHIDEALRELNRRDPLKWPAVKHELRGEMPVTLPLPLAPLDSRGQRVDASGARVPDLLRPDAAPASGGTP